MSDSSWVSYIKFIDWSWVLTFIFSSLVYGVEIFFLWFLTGFGLVYRWVLGSGGPFILGFGLKRAVSYLLRDLFIY